MLPRESRSPRRQRRVRRQADVSAVESLEKRTVLSFSTLGYSLPDLTISGEAGPRGALGRNDRRVGLSPEHWGKQHHRAAVAVAADGNSSGRITLRVNQLSRCAGVHDSRIGLQESEVVKRVVPAGNFQRAGAVSK